VRIFVGEVSKFLAIFLPSIAMHAIMALLQVVKENVAFRFVGRKNDSEGCFVEVGTSINPGI
jgi:hypothetical protein